MTTRNRFDPKEHGFVHVQDDYRQYNWDTGLWDISHEFWASKVSRHMLCVECWTVGTDDWRSL